MIRLCAACVALFNRSGDVFPDWTTPGAVGVLPRQPILLTRSADDALRILVYVVKLPLTGGIFVLGFHVSAADFNRVQFIGADAAVKEFLFAGFAVEKPLFT